MNIVPETTRVLISPIEDKSLIQPPTESLMRQASLVVQNRELDDEAFNQKMETLSMQTSAQLRAGFNMDNQARLTEEINKNLSSNVGPEVVALGLETLYKKQYNNQAALEEEYVNTIKNNAAKNPVTQYIMENDRSFFSSLVEDSKKKLAISNKLEEIKQSSDWADTGLNLVSEISMVSFLQRSFGFGLIDYADELRDLQAKLEKASAEEAISILDEAEAVVRATQILGDNPDYVYGELATAFQGSLGSQKVAGLMNFFDFADTGLIAKDLLKGSLKIGKGVIKRGSESDAFIKIGDTESLAEDIATGDRKIVENNIEQMSLGTGLRTEFDEAVGLSGEVRASYEANKRILQEVLDKPKGVTFEDVENINIAKNLKDKLKKEFTKGSITDISFKSDDTADIILLTNNGSAYARKSDAQAGITKRGLGGEPFEFPSGKWGIKVNLPLEDVKDANLSTQGVSWFTRQLRRPAAWVDDDMLVYSQMGEAALNRILKQGQEVYDSSIGKLSRGQTKDFLPLLERVIEVGEETKQWMTPKEVDVFYREQHNRPATVKEMEAYAGYRLLNEFQYELDNKVIYDKKKAQGYGTIPEGVFGEGILPVNARKAEILNEHDYIYSKETGGMIDKNDMPKDFLEKYDILRIDDTSVLEKEMDIVTPYVAVLKDSVKIEELDYRQLNYLAGGRKRYDNDTVFLKQANTYVAPNGKKYRNTDSTFFSASSMPQAKKIQEEINAINGVLRKGEDLPEVREQAGVLLKRNKTLGVSSVTEWIELMTEKGIDRLKDIQSVRNRGVVSQEGLPSEFVDDVDFVEQANGRLGKRGLDSISHVDPDSKSLLNPVASLNQNFIAASQNASLSAYRDYSLAYLERYRKFLNVDEKSPRIALLDAPIKDNANLTSRQAEMIKGHQKFANEVMGRRTGDEIRSQSTLENNIAWALQVLPEKIDLNVGGFQKRLFDKNKFIGSAGNTTVDGITGKIRGMVFNAKLGLFSLPAMAIQAIHAPIISIMAPKHGFAALTTYPVLRMALLSRDPQVVSEFAKKAEKLGLTGYGDMQKFFQEFRNLGFDSFGPNMAYENAAMGDNLVRSTTGKVLDAGRVFFEEGELMPRMVGYATAVREFRDNIKGLNPKGLDIDSPEGSKYITERVNTLTLGMTRADLQQGLKSGVLGLAAQFQSYPLRAMDALLFPSKGLTRGERSRLAAAYVIFYGGAGLPLLNGVVDKIVQTTDVEENKALTKTLYNGVIDGLVMAITGEDTNFASRGGLGDWAKEIMKSFNDPRVSVLEVVLGPAGSTGSGALDTMIQYAQARSAGYNPDPEQITSSVIFDVAKQVSSFNNLYRAWIAYNTGKIYDSRGNQFIEISNTKNLLQIFGIPPQEYANVGALFSHKDKRKQIIDMNVEFLVKLNTELLRSESFEERESLRNQINSVSYYVQQDGLSEEVNARVANKLAEGDTHNKLINEAKLLEAVGKDGLPTELEALND